jgi:transcription elongation factor Elf1
MAKEMREVLVCDVCGSEQDVAVVAITLDGAEQSGELCAEHRQALQQAVADILPASTTSRPARAAQPATAVGRAAKRAARAARKRVERQGTPKRQVTCPHCGLEMSVQNLSRHIAAKHPDATE